MTEQTPETETGERRDDEYGLDPAVVEAVREALGSADREAVLACMEELHVADIADLIEQIDADDRRALIGLAWNDIDPEVLTELEEGVRDDVLRLLAPPQVAKAVRALETDDIVYVIEDMEEAERREVMAALDPADRVAVARSLTYPEDSAGRLMQRNLVKAPPYWTVGQMIDLMRASEDLPEQFYDVIIVDPAMKPVGTVPLSRIMGTRRPVTLESLMEDDFRTVGVLDSQEDVAYVFNQYRLISAPVVDEDDRLIGVITIDDAIEVMDEVAEEDILRLGGVGDEEIADTVWEIVKLRVPWLLVNLVTAIAAALVIGLFEAQIAALVALAVLMPVVASMGGNAGTQTLTVAVRALATRNLTRANALRVVGREVTVGIANGVTFAVVMGGVTYAWFHNPLLAVVIGSALIVNMTAAGLVGILIPMGLERIGVDPAVASGPFVTTTTDITGFFAFLGLASIVLL